MIWNFGEHPHFTTLKNIACRMWNISPEVLIHGGRTEELVDARCVLAVISREYLGLTLRSTGDCLGLSHSQITNLLQRHDEIMEFTSQRKKNYKDSFDGVLDAYSEFATSKK